jgi:hypothetical protein
MQNTTNHQSNSPIFRSGELINDTWEIIKKVGKGSFCELLVARNSKIKI